MSGKATLPQWLIVVRRERRDLYESLRRGFASDPRVDVILDRRQAERRATEAGAETDRRRRQRRKPLTSGERAVWDTVGFQLIHRDHDLIVYQAEGEPKD